MAGGVQGMVWEGGSGQRRACTAAAPGALHQAAGSWGGTSARRRTLNASVSSVELSPAALNGGSLMLKVTGGEGRSAPSARQQHGAAFNPWPAATLPLRSTLASSCAACGIHRCQDSDTCLSWHTASCPSPCCHTTPASSAAQLTTVASSGPVVAAASEQEQAGRHLGRAHGRRRRGRARRGRGWRGRERARGWRRGWRRAGRWWAGGWWAGGWWRGWRRRGRRRARWRRAEGRWRGWLLTPGGSFTRKGVQLFTDRYGASIFMAGNAKHKPQRLQRGPH